MYRICCIVVHSMVELALTQEFSRRWKGVAAYELFFKVERFRHNDASAVLNNL